jgi:hypothetical protein
MKDNTAFAIFIIVMFIIAVLLLFLAKILF